MLLIPAIDIKDRKVVRLVQGNYEEETVYSDDPVKIAADWVSCGATLIHIVDLDGALTGRIKNLDIVEEIVKNVAVRVQFGGGIRTMKDVESVLNTGVTKVILGTKACEDDNFVKELVIAFGEKVIVSIDVRRGKVLTSGWTATTGFKPTVLAKRMENLGVKSLIYTDISKDGTLKGPNTEGLKEILYSVKIPVILSGGISSLDDITALKFLESDGLYGIILGKALYEKKIDLREAINLAK